MTAMKLRDAPRKKSCDKLGVLKSKGIALLTKVHIIEAMVFPADYGCELDCKEGCAFKPVNPKWKAALNIHWKD